MGIHTWFYESKEEDANFITKYNDCFRMRLKAVTNYDDIELKSLEETINFIQSNQSNFEPEASWFPDGYMDKIKEFWEKYPNGQIDFG